MNSKRREVDTCALETVPHKYTVNSGRDQREGVMGEIGRRVKESSNG